MTSTGIPTSNVNPPLPEPLKPLPPLGEIELTPLPPVSDSIAWVDRIIAGYSDPAVMAARKSATAARVALEQAHPDYTDVVATLSPVVVEHHEVIAAFDRLGITTTGHQG